jgi:uncharacterized protein YukE
MSDYVIGYAEVEAAAQTFAEAAEEYQKMINQLNSVSEELTKKSFVGKTGPSAANYIEVINQRLTKMIQDANEMRADLLSAIGQMQDDTDPSMAQRFDN